MTAGGKADDAEIVDVTEAGGMPGVVAPGARRSPSGRRGLDRALQTVAVLQTTLDVRRLLALFAREVAETVPHSSMAFRAADSGRAVVRGREARHAYNCRLVLEKRVLGEITFTRSRPFSQRETGQLEFLLCTLAYPLRNALAHDEAVQRGLRDALTGVYNRAFLEEALRRETALARRYKTPLSLIVLDIDDFKAINDEHGHEAGDRVLVAVTEAVRACLRESDILSRYGGDEFTVLLSSTDAAGARVLARNIAARCRDARIGIGDREVRITVSMGIAALRRRDRLENLFARADEALLRAKRAGKDTVRVAGGRG